MARKRRTTSPPPPTSQSATKKQAASGSTRRLGRWLATGLVVVGLGVAGVLWWQRGSSFALLPAGTDQNVLLVTIDTTRADALSCYGGPADTPNLDELASHGARFTFAHSHAVVTLPSHTSILTGHYPYEHGIRDNSGFRVKDGTATLATRLKALGFATGAFIGGFPVTKRFGLSPGFDTYDDQLPEMRGDVSYEMPERRADVVVGRALDWIGNQQGRFFGWVHLFDPHSPYRPPPEYLEKYRAQPYYGEIAFVDHALGPLFDRLATLSRPTVVIVTADHGESLGEHGEMTHGMFAYEATLHIPLIIAEVNPTAKRTFRGSMIDVPVRHIDIAPTVLDIAGAPVDPSLPGSSLREVISTGQSPARPQYFEAMTYNLVRGWAPLRGVLIGKTKYIDLPIPELYELVPDPTEAHNLAPQDPTRVQVMYNTLRTYNTSDPERPSHESADVAAAMRALGYTTGSAPARATYTEADDPKRLVQVDQDLHKATELYQDGKVEQAIALWNSVVTRRPDTADAYLALAAAYYEAGQIEPAIATLEKALANGAPDRDVRVRLGVYLAEGGGDSAKAIRVLESLPNTDVEALNSLGIAYIDAGRYADATKTFQRLLALDPTNGLAYQNLADGALKQAHTMKPGTDRSTRLRDAEEYARKAVELDPTLAGAYTILGVTLSDEDRKPEAIDAWKHAVDLDATEFNAMYNLWMELASANRRDEAVKYGKQFVDTAPPSAFQPQIEEIRRYIGKLAPAF